MSRRAVVNVIDDDDSVPSPPAVAARTRSATQHQDSRASSASTENRGLGTGRSRKVKVRPAATAGPRLDNSAAATRHQSSQEVPTVVDLTKSSPADDQEDVVLVSVSHSASQPATSLLLASCRRLSSAAAAAIPSLGAGPFASKQARTKHKDSPSPTAILQVPPRTGPQCGICMDSLKDPACGSCGHIYCETCLKDSLKVQKKCPSCRKTMQLRQVRRVYL